jgi:porphobilinogen deaminase
LATIDGDALTLEGMVTDVSGKKILHAREEGIVVSPEEVGVRLAQRMLDMGASEFIAGVRDG